MTTDELFTNRQITAEMRHKLFDAELIRDAYQSKGSIRRAARSIGVGVKSFRNALELHGIPVSTKGQSPDVTRRHGITRADVVKATYRAYLKADKCPPSCEGRATCLDDRCILAELAR